MQNLTTIFCLSPINISPFPFQNRKYACDPDMTFWYKLQVGYDRNRIIRPETGTEPEFRFRLTGTGIAFKNSGSG